MQLSISLSIFSDAYKKARQTHFKSMFEAKELGPISVLSLMQERYELIMEYLDKYQVQRRIQEKAPP